MNYHKTLNVSQKATTAEIRKSYLFLAERCHPKKQITLQSTADIDPANLELFRALSEAYAVLSDSFIRSIYEEYGIHRLNASYECGLIPWPLGVNPRVQKSFKFSDSIRSHMTLEGALKVFEEAFESERPDLGPVSVEQKRAVDDEFDYYYQKAIARQHKKNFRVDTQIVVTALPSKGWKDLIENKQTNSATITSGMVSKAGSGMVSKAESELPSRNNSKPGTLIITPSPNTGMRGEARSMAKGDNQRSKSALLPKWIKRK